VRLFEALRERLQNGSASNIEAPFVEPIPEPDPEPNRRWMAAHRREYAGQWVALDDDRLIANGTSAKEIFTAAQADGAYLPLVIFVPPANEPPFVGM
jgi:hypothetical protein